MESLFDSQHSCSAAITLEGWIRVRSVSGWLLKWIESVLHLLHWIWLPEVAQSHSSGTGIPTHEVRQRVAKTSISDEGTLQLWFWFTAWL